MARNAETIRPDLKRNPQGKVEYLFGLARGTLDDEAIKLYESHGQSFVMAWQSAEYVAPLYIQRGKPKAAWVAIESNLMNWWPVDHAQVAPMVLLTNEHLETLMTPERCLWVLSTPRGPEGAKSGK